MIRKLEPIKTPKKWGAEEEYINDEYCVKALYIDKGEKFSMHFHSEKHEVWLVVSGKVICDWIDTRTATRNEATFSRGDCIEVQRNTPHQLYGVENTVIVECSTPHYDYDSYRVEKGASQK